MIGITGVATSGKDTLFKLIKQYFKEKNLQVERYALADLLKKDIEFFIKEKFNLDIFNLEKEEKELIRPILVTYGKIKRLKTDGRYWIDKLENNSEFKKANKIKIITDIRYQEFQKDECYWLKKENNGFLIHVSRICNGKVIPPANAEESKNDVTLASQADYSMIWCTEKNIDRLYEDYKMNLKEIYELYTRRF